MLDINLRALEPLARIDRVPQQREEHHPTVEEARVVHRQLVEVGASNSWEAEDGDNKCYPGAGDGANWLGEAAEVPWA